MNRQELLRICTARQGGLCVICGHNLHGNADLHEAIVKKGDLPKSRQKLIFDERNCVAIHHGPPCHVNTKENDEICYNYLLEYYGEEALIDWVLSLRFKILPIRARKIVYGS